MKKLIMIVLCALAANWAFADPTVMINKVVWC